MARTITWLHLSDLHSCLPNTGWDARRVLDTLIKDLKVMRANHGLIPDLIFFTGDAAFGHLGSEKGKAIGDQFREAHEFLTAVRNEYSPTIPQRNVFLVPGNHDVNRTLITKFESEWLNSEQSLVDIEKMIRDADQSWRQLMRRLQDYEHALLTFGYDHLLTNRERLIFGDMREIAGVRLGISGFNSAWSSRGIGREESGRLWISGRFQLETNLNEMPRHDLRVALIHHPGNWFVPEENPTFFRELEREFEFVLHGHEHIDFVRQDESNNHAVISAGACHEWSTTKNNGYNFVRLDLESATGQVWLREYESAGGGWRPRVITGKTDNNGLWRLNLLKILGKMDIDFRLDAISTVTQLRSRSDSTFVLAATEYEKRYRKAVVDRLDHMQLFGVDLPRDSKEYPLSIAFVSVNLIDDAAVESEDVDEDERIPLDSESSSTANTTLPAEKFFEKLNSTPPRLLIRGTAGSGKTTLLRWAAVQAGKARQDNGWKSLVPFLIRLRDYPDANLPRPQDYPLMLAKELPDAPAGWMQSLLEEGRALLLFDGVDEVPESKRSFAIWEIRNLLSSYPRNACVVTSRTEAIDSGEFKALHFITSRVETLTPIDRNKLIDRWHEAMETQLRRRSEVVDLKPLAERLKSRLEQLPAVARLTVNPLLCAVVCALHRDREENLPDTPVGLCEKLTEMLLDRRDRERPGKVDYERAEDRTYQQITYSQRKGLLTRLARHMVLDGRSALEQSAAIEQVRLGLESYQLERLNANRVFQLLIERSGLLQESSERSIEFIHNTLKEYLAAERFVNGGELQVLVDNCHDEAWQPVILFAVALPRDGSEFATQLIRGIRDKTQLESPKLSRKAEERKLASTVRTRQFFFLRCCLSAHQINDSQLQQQFRDLRKDLLPPRTLTDAEILADCGDAIVPYLELNEHYSATQRAACARALRLIGGSQAKRLLTKYLGDRTMAVGRELSLSVEDPLSIRAVLVFIEHFGMLPDWAVKDFVSDISPLSKLRTLMSLDLSYTHVDDIWAIDKLVRLRTLNLAGTNVHDIAPLAKLTKLQDLFLEYTKVVDLIPLSKLGDLNTLNLSGTPVRSLSALGNLTQLRELDLNHTQIKDLAGIEKLSELVRLDLSGTQVSDVAALSGLSRLTSLNLSSTQVGDISPLSGLVNLDRLYLNGTLVNSITALAGLSRLTFLDLSSTGVDDVGALSSISNLHVVVESLAVRGLSSLHSYQAEDQVPF